MINQFDIIIIGAGPSGCGLSLALHGSGLKIALLEKSDFPRRKVCGGALSERSLNRLKEFPAELELFEKFIKSVKKMPTYGLRIFSPGMNILEYVFGTEKDLKYPPGFVCNRSDFDNFLLEEVKKLPDVNYFGNTKADKIVVLDDSAEVYTEQGIFSSALVACAYGAQSSSEKCLIGGKIKIKKDVGISAHFENVSGFDDKNLIDIYFLKETLPGYFWVFSLPDGMANAGLGMEVNNKHKKAEVNPKKLFEHIVSTYPEISQRFERAKQTDEFKGGILPMINGKLKDQKNIRGNRYLLLGDAAGLIDPFNGEGIGNALTSAVFASEAVREAFKKNNFSADGLKLYGDLLNKKLGKELVRHNRIRSFFYKNPRVLNSSLKLIKSINLIKNGIGLKLYRMKTEN